ncbi:hypothetical protein [Sulfurimonas sp.]|uniref:hypothetical protein n=1 Tax=Sulfurimonas sp. TaxID=2022749 RepID=UPI002B48B131|nr:hypothetical protein [Sulfurimonas sp.]
MQKIKLLILLLSILSITGCVNKEPLANKQKKDELLQFAQANCMLWYFKKKGYDTQDIRAISGGIVELGSYSAEKYQNVAFLVKKYSPNLHSKNNIDVALWKCYKLDSDKLFLEKLDNIKK